MLPALLIGLADSLINAFAPLATEKLTAEIARHTDKPEVAQQISTAIIDTAKAVTGKTDAIEAVAAAKADPTAMAQIQESALDELAKLAPVLDKLAALDQAQWQRDEDSRAAASARSAADPNGYVIDLLMTNAIIRMMVGLLLGTVALIGTLAYFKVSENIISGLVALLTTLAGLAAGKFGTRYDNKYGSSSGSQAKDVLIGEMASRRGK